MTKQEATQAIMRANIEPALRAVLLAMADKLEWADRDRRRWFHFRLPRRNIRP
jgi:hypothetical protein